MSRLAFISLVIFASAMCTAADPAGAASVGGLLQNVPSAQVDVEGNVSLRGNDNVLVFLTPLTTRKKPKGLDFDSML